MAWFNFTGNASKYSDINMDPIVPIIRVAVDPLNTMATNINSEASNIPSAILLRFSFHITIKTLNAKAIPSIRYSITTPMLLIFVFLALNLYL